MHLPFLPPRAPSRSHAVRSLRFCSATVLGSLLLWTGGVTPQHASAASAVSHPSVCGPRATTSQLVEPPNVEVWTLPTNEDGDHELILAVHSDRVRFCYSFLKDGAMQPGAPTIRVRRGERFALRLVNEITGPSKGARVPSSALPACMPQMMPMSHAPVAHWVGYLNHTIDDRYMRMKPIDTNIHLHGFEGPADQENVFLSTLSTPLHACEYHITIPNDQPAGTYFYHPHVHGVSDLQVAAGLTGAWIVEPDTPQIERSAEHVLVIRYRMPFKNDNPFAPDPTPAFNLGAVHEAALKAGPPVAYNPFDPPPWPMTAPMHGAGITFDPAGCDGVASEAVSTLNGVGLPALLDVPGNQPQLLRLLNATSDTPKQLELHDQAGHVVPMRVVERDGVPVSGDPQHPMANYRAMDALMLAPAARASILISAEPGQSLTLTSTHYCEGAWDFYQTAHELLRIHGSAASATAPAPAFAPAPLNTVDVSATKLLEYARSHPASIRKRAITFTEYGFPKRGKVPPHAGYYITDTTNPNFHEHPYWPTFAAGATAPSDADIVVKQGSIEEWYLFNTTLETHIFHIHQMAFVAEDAPGGAFTADTIFVPVGKIVPNPREPNYPLVKPTLVKALLDFRHVPRGTFVFHCHMLFHEDNGMMAIIRVV